MFNTKQYSPLRWALCTAIFICACLDDEQANLASSGITENLPLTGLEKDGLPANSSNPFDLTGQTYYAVLSEFLCGEPLPETIAEVEEEVTRLLNEYAFPADSVNREGINIPDLLITSQSVMDSVLLNSSMSSNARLTVQNYLAQTTGISTKDWEEILAYSITFETSVQNHLTFSLEEKRMLLTMASVIRYACYFSKGRDDQDWDVSVGNRGAAIGALDDAESALYFSLVSGICKNLGITD